jgi:hypothetical protein
MDSLENAIIIERDVWLSSYLSVAKYYGGISLNGHEYSRAWSCAGLS